LKLYPPTYINIGTLDPLFDDGILMAQRINKHNGGKVKLDIFDGLGHGYMNMTDFLNEGDSVGMRLSSWILKYLEDSKEEK
jgi:acetyl esterase/lipase